MSNPRPQELPALEVLQQTFFYDPASGLLYRRLKNRLKVTGTRSGPRLDRLQTFVSGRLVHVSRVCWTLHYGQDPFPHEIDHRNRNSLDNCITNLRIAGRGGNVRNTGKRSTNKSGYKGVYWRADMGTWRAAITIDYKRVSLGYFDTPEQAHAAYCKAALELHGDFANFG
jgi:hypothetical protein